MKQWWINYIKEKGGVIEREERQTVLQASKMYKELLLLIQNSIIAPVLYKSSMSQMYPC